MTARKNIAAGMRNNADAWGVGIPLILSALAEQYLGVQLDTQTAMAVAGLLGSLGAKIKRAW